MSVKFHRLVAAWSLLALMALVVTPPSTWHHHGAIEAHHDADGAATVENICPVCDHALPIAVQERIAGLSFVVHVIGLDGPCALPIADVGHVLRNTDRGPPSLG
ncbi:MAG: hypothetical protein KA791_05940 [Flavobacteriales bacterium]|nr:hypothetical protein [Flavobacteriales bacterium]